MKHLLEYITEALLFEGNDEESKINSDNLLKALNNHSGNLTDFVNALNSALKHADDKDNAKLWMGAIKDLFDGENGEQYKASNHVAVKITDLYPTQSEIDIENSAKWVTKDWGAKGVADMFKKEAFGKSFPVPVLVYKADGKNWIIDGHHRWSQVGLINRDASLDCLVVEGPESVQDFLKITQGTIASVLASDNGNSGKKGDHQLPVGAAKPENNIFGPNLKGDKLKERIKQMLDKADPKILKILNTVLQNCKVINKKGNLVQGEVNEKLFDVANPKLFKESFATLVMNNRDKMIENGQNPPKWAAPRPVMPQSDAAGPNDPKNAKDGNPDNEGSALYKILHKGKFPSIDKNN